MNYKEFLKNLMLAFLLTEVFYPRPLCTLAHSGISCFPFPSPFGLFTLVYGLDLLIVLLISLFTAFTFIYFKTKKSFVLNKTIKNETTRTIVIFLVTWIGFMIIFSVPYYLYGRYANPTGGIE